ncbi:ABC transporter ATP-binding protein [Megasphaera cerevisiae]|uniref:ABC transporter ATP-binding protein n=1 Tax=Megasphaera cerevisiae TaxID=39029 RepID=UPI0009455646|nr:ATP-binding cassette domain-containing protein [Megasphaera cerevisiae]OKY53054.1 aliphatic sulfonate ABC transporter ATP-binding protein [Megasphaera cerevisiae]
MAGYSIQIRNLTKRYGSTEVLRNINLTIKEGEFVGLVGKSGCGKSTLLRIVSALTRSSGGSIKINGREALEIDPEVRFLFQDARLLPWKTVLENVILGSPERNKEKALQALQAVDLEDRKNFWPSDLSGGQRQRVSLARALVGTPRVLLLDEPLSALDALTRINMQRLIEKLWQEWRFTVVLVTHDVSEAVYLADRVILIENGEIGLDEKIKLARPRLKNNDSAYYEGKILDRILKPQQPELIQYTI